MNMLEKNKVSRREALGLLGFAGAAMGAGCGTSPTTPSALTTTSGTTASNTSTSSGTSATTSAGCVTSPEETAGPYPDRIGMINNTAYFRSDIAEGRSGLPLTLLLTVVNTKSGCSPVANANVEIWQCDASGNYSEYAQPSFNGVGQTFLRGVQTTNGSGQVTFRTIYPGWYAGRATHIHVQVFMKWKPLPSAYRYAASSVTRSGSSNFSAALKVLSNTARVIRFLILILTRVCPPRAVGLDTSTSRQWYGAPSNSKYIFRLISRASSMAVIVVNIRCLWCLREISRPSQQTLLRTSPLAPVVQFPSSPFTS